MGYRGHVVKLTTSDQFTVIVPYSRMPVVNLTLPPFGNDVFGTINQQATIVLLAKPIILITIH